MKKLNVLTALVFIIVLIINTGAQETEKTLKFKKGESSAVVAGSLLRGEEVSYILKANKDQNMVVTISSTENNAVFRIKDRTSRYYLDGAGEIDDAIKWQGSLPSDGEYKIIIGGTKGNAEYTLNVYIE